MKRVLTMILVLAMLCMLLPQIALFASAETSGTCGKNVRWSFNQATGELTITGSGPIEISYDSVSIPITPWDSFRKDVRSATVGEGITALPDMLFWNGFPNMKKIDLPNSLTSIGRLAFMWSGLESVVIGSPDIGTKQPLSIGDHAFKACENLKSVEIYSGLTKLWEETFASSSIEYIALPATLTGLYRQPLDKNHATIYFGGTQAQWNAITCYYCDPEEVLGGRIVHFNLPNPRDHSYFLTSHTASTCAVEGTDKYDCVCGASWNETTPTTDHDWQYSSTVLPSCGADGYDIEICSFCKSSRQTNPVTERPPHPYEETVFPATCLTAGYSDFLCPDCGATYRGNFVQALGHSFTDWETTAAATCTTPGAEIRFCNRCDYYETHKVDAPGHDYIAEIHPVGCTEDGYTTYTCSRCKDSYDSDKITATGHKYQSVVTAPTCTDGGYTTATCTKCGDSYISSKTEATGHSYSKTTVLPSCTENGYTEYVCANCGDSYRTDEVAAFGHDYETGVITPTCTEDGYTVYTCRTCNDTYTDEIAEALGHDFDDWYLFSEATCTEPDIEHRDCARCGEAEARDGENAALGHEWDDGEVRTPASAYGDGLKVYTCLRCGATRDDVLPRLSVCDGGDGCPTEEYTDVPAPSNWAHAGIDFCVSEGLMGSTKTDALTFEPNTPTSRAMIVSILYRLEGSPAVSYKVTFTDVPSDKWFTDGVTWASENGVVAGYGNGKFGPNDSITREQLASILMRYTNFKGYKTNTLAELSLFSDASKISSWASLSVKWAAGARIVSGKASGGKTLMDPQGKATRAEVASILMRYIGMIDSLQPLNNAATCSHSWVVNTSKAATCTAGGSTAYYCTECASEKTETSSALGHDDVKVDSLAPTCTEAGWNQWHCNRCGRTYKDPKPALGHDDVKSVAAATCTTGGYEQFTCKRCGRSYKQNQTSALGHSYKNGFCIRCDAVDSSNGYLNLLYGTWYVSFSFDGAGYIQNTYPYGLTSLVIQGRNGTWTIGSKKYYISNIAYAGYEEGVYWFDVTFDGQPWTLYVDANKSSNLYKELILTSIVGGYGFVR